MACVRCLNKTWEGPYPHCSKCVTCPTCKGLKVTMAEVPARCSDCNGRGWKHKETKPVIVRRLTAGSVVIPTTISLQLTPSKQITKSPAFEILQTSLSAGAADLNKQPFLATITLAGYLSDGCVGGTESITDESGKVIGPLRIFIPVEVMAKRVPELISKGVFAADTLDTHDGAIQIGQFVDSYMERIIGTEIHVVKGSGFLDKKANPDLVAKIVERARTGEMGFSYDLKDAPGHLDSEMYPGQTILVLDGFKWRGATAIRREAAAYFYTQLAAKKLGTASAHTAADPQPSTLPAGTSTGSTPAGEQSGDLDMTPEQLAALAAAMTEANKPVLAEIAKVSAAQVAMEARVVAVEAKTATAAAAPQKTAAELEAERLAAAAKPGASLSVADLTTAMTAALKAAGIGAAPEAGKGTRSTLSAEQLKTVTRYAPTGFSGVEGENLTLEGATALVEHIKQTYTGSEQAKALQLIVPIKKNLERESLGVN